MIRLTDLAGNNTFSMGGRKFEYGKVYSNPFATAFAPQMDEAKKVDVTKLKKGDKVKINMGGGKEEVEVMGNMKAGVSKTTFVTLKRKAGAPYTITLSKLEKILTEAEGSEDHEVSMAQNQLDSIIKYASELKQHLGDDEKQIPAWIQDHISKSQNYISQAASNYHEYGDSNEANVTEAGPCWKGYQQVGMKMKNGKEVPNCVPKNEIKEAGVPKMYVKYAAVQKKVRELEDKQKAMGAKYFAEKDPKKKAAMMPALKKGTAQLAAYRRNLSDIETKYINNIWDDEDGTALKAAKAANRDMRGYGGLYNNDFD